MQTKKTLSKGLWSTLLFCLAQTVTAQNIAPNAIEDSYTVSNNVTTTIAATNGVLTNDTDSNGFETLTVNPNPVINVNNGSLVLNTDGSFTYTPNSNFLGTDTFTYQVCDDGLPIELVSQFDFDSPILTEATVGPDATSINPDATSIECGVHIPSGSGGGSVGLDLIVPNTGNIFNFTSFEIGFEYRDQEGVANLVEGGNFRIFHFSANNIGVEVTVINGNTGIQETFTQNLGSFLAGNNPYIVTYNEVTGNIIFNANGTITNFPLAPAFSPLDSTLASDIIIGRQADNSGRDFASFCSVTIKGTQALCDTAVVNIAVTPLPTSIITNRRITYRINPN